MLAFTVTLFFPLLALVSATALSQPASGPVPGLRSLQLSGYPHIQRRQGTGNSTNLPGIETFKGWLHELSMGTEPRTYHLLFDLGFHGLMMGTDCADSDTICQGYLRYNPNMSTTATKVDPNNDLDKFEPESDDITYYRDHFHPVRPHDKDGRLFGVVKNLVPSMPSGLYGYGPHHVTGFNKSKLSLMDTILDRDFPDSRRMFTLDHRKSSDPDYSRFTIGAINPGSYWKKLQKLPIIMPGPESQLQNFGYYVTMDWASLWANGSSITILETGDESTTSGETIVRIGNDPYISLPSSAFYQIQDELNLNCSRAYVGEPCELDCAYLQDNEAKICITFQDTRICIFIEHMITEFKSKCYLDLQRTRPGDTPVLGDAFLRHAYLAFDWDDPAIYVAGKWNCDKPSVNVTSLSDYDSPGCDASSPPRTSSTSLPGPSTVTEVETATITSCVPGVISCTKSPETAVTSTHVTGGSSGPAASETPASASPCSKSCKATGTPPTEPPCSTCGGGPEASGPSAGGSGKPNETAPAATGGPTPSTVAGLAERYVAGTWTVGLVVGVVMMVAF